MQGGLAASEALDSPDSLDSLDSSSSELRIIYLVFWPFCRPFASHLIDFASLSLDFGCDRRVRCFLAHALTVCSSVVLLSLIFFRLL